MVPEAVPAAAAKCEVIAADTPAKRWTPAAWVAAAKGWTQAVRAAGALRLVLLAVCTALVGLLTASLCAAPGLAGWAGLRAAVAGRSSIRLPGVGAMCGAAAVFLTLCVAVALGWRRVANRRVDKAGDDAAKAKHA